MDIGSDNRIKLYAVIGLAIVAGVIAYVRFFRDPRKAGPPDKASPVANVGYEIPDLPEWLSGNESIHMQERPPYAPPLRDIFFPAPPPVEVEQAPAPPPEAEPEGPPSLSAVMMSTQGAVAVISGRVVRKGEKVGGYTVVEISRRGAILTKGTDRLVLTMAE